MIRNLLLTLLSVTLFVGCHQSPQKPQHFKASLSSEPPSLDPTIPFDTTSSIIIRSLFDSLMRIAPSGKLEPSVAKRYSLSDDKLVYTFFLRDTLWSNNTPVTAYDFAYSLHSILSPNSQSQSAHLYYIIKNAEEVRKGTLPIDALGLKVIDDKTLEFTLKHPAPYFPELLTNLYPVVENIREEYPNWSYEAGPLLISNGPFILKEWRHHHLIELIPNPHYWDKETVQLQHITFYMIEDPSTELAMFDDGELDWAGAPFSIGLPLDALASLEAEGRLHTDSTLSTYFYFLNPRHPLLKNKKIRQALAYAIDRKRLTTHLMRGGQEPATSFVPKAMSQATTPFFPDGDPELARKLLKEGLKELGIDPKDTPPIALIYNTSQGHHLIAQYVQEVWNRELNINCSLQNMEWKVFLDRSQQCDFDVARMGNVADYRDPVTFLDLLRYNERYLNCLQFNNPRYLELMAQADLTLDEEIRANLLLKAEKIVAEEMPLIPIYNYSESYIKNPKFEKIILTAPSKGDLKWAYFK